MTTMHAYGELEELIVRLQRGESKISPEDLRAFLKNPTLWRQGATMPVTSDLDCWMQDVYDELRIETEVPQAPKLTERQERSLAKFGFRIFYVPAITEADYPSFFVKPNWGKYIDASSIERKPLVGNWVAIETVRKPDWNDSVGYPDDRLAAALKLESRFRVSHDDLTGGLLAKIAKKTGFPKNGLRLPTAEEWNFLANLFNWLRENRQENLPNLGSTNSWEWCENGCGSRGRLIVGGRGFGGLAGVHGRWHDNRSDSTAFRALAVL